jgi:ABC-type uncharacterized transport system permease subunit
MKQFLINLITSIKAKFGKHIDKVLHASLCYAITYTVADKTALWLGVFIAVLIGVGMELIDRVRSKFSIADLIADGLGIVIAFLIVGV